MNHSQLRDAIREANAKRPDYRKGMTLRWWAKQWNVSASTVKRDTDTAIDLGMWIKDKDWRKWGGMMRLKDVYRPKDGYEAPKEADE